MDSPEERARINIDRLLAAAGWEVQDRRRVNLGAATGVAVREFPLATGEADYLLFVQRKAIGGVEAKPEGATLSGVEMQSGKYAIGLPAQVPAWRRSLPFLYESTGVETFFTNGLDPQPRSRRVFAFHRPETLAEWAADGGGAVGASTRAGASPAPTLRGRLRQMPPRYLVGGRAGRTVARDKVNLDIFWLRDESLEDSASLPEPDVLAAEIVEDLQAALEQFAAIAEDLGE